MKGAWQRMTAYGLRLLFCSISMWVLSSAYANVIPATASVPTITTSSAASYFFAPHLSLAVAQTLSTSYSNTTSDTHEASPMPTGRNRLLASLANPEVALVLLMIGIFGLFFEFTNPGMTLPGVVGAICLLLGLYAFELLPVNWAGVALISVGAMLMIAEAFLPTFGIVALGGLVAFFLGGLFLMNSDATGVTLSIPFLLGIGVASVVLLFAAGAMAATAYKRKVVTGREEMLGLPGVVTMVGDQASYADVRGESWRIQCREPLSVGDLIQVISIEGLTLQVVRQPFRK